MLLDHSWTPYHRTVYGYIHPVVVTATIITNCLVCAVLVRRFMCSATSTLLIAMVISDTLTGLLPTPCFLIFYGFGLYEDWVPFDWHLPYVYSTEHLPTVFHTASMWLTVALVAQRYVHVCHEGLGKRVCRTWQASLYGHQHAESHRHHLLASVHCSPPRTHRDTSWPRPRRLPSTTRYVTCCLCMHNTASYPRWNTGQMWWCSVVTNHRQQLWLILAEHTALWHMPDRSLSAFLLWVFKSNQTCRLLVIRKLREFAASTAHQKLKRFKLQWSLPPWSLDQLFTRGPRWGLCLTAFHFCYSLDVETAPLLLQRWHITGDL